MPCTLFVFVSWISFAMPLEGGERAGNSPYNMFFDQDGRNPGLTKL